MPSLAHSSSIFISNSYLSPFTDSIKGMSFEEKPRKPVCVSLTFTPAANEKTNFVMLLPNLLRSGIFPENLRQPIISLSGELFRASDTLIISSTLCCPSASAMTMPTVSDSCSFMYSSAVFMPRPLPLFTSWVRTMAFFAASAKIGSLSLPLPSLMTII